MSHRDDKKDRRNHENSSTPPSHVFRKSDPMEDEANDGETYRIEVVRSLKRMKAVQECSLRKHFRTFHAGECLAGAQS